MARNSALRASVERLAAATDLQAGEFEKLLMWASDGSPRFEDASVIEPSELVSLVDLVEAQATPQTAAVLRGWLLSTAALLSALSAPDALDGPRTRHSGADETLAALQAALADGSGLGVIRAADGEGKILPMWDDMAAASSPVPLAPTVRSLLLQHANVKWNNWFGVSAKGREALVESIGADFRSSIAASSAIGVRSTAALDAQLNRWRSSGTAPTALSLYSELAIRRFARLTSDGAKFAMDAVVDWNSRGPLRQLMQSSSRVVLVTAYPEAVDYVANAAGVAAELITIPSERKPSVPDDIKRRDIPGEHLDQFESLKATVASAAEPGVLVLVAGGLLGKIYVDVAARAGASALDIGAVVDGWLGLETRPRLKAKAAALALG